jgi:hypothetical protein
VSFIINTKDNAGTPVDSTGIISNVKLVSGSTVFVDISEPMLRQWGQLRHDIPFGQEKDSTGICRHGVLRHQQQRESGRVVFPEPVHRRACCRRRSTRPSSTSSISNFDVLAAGTIFVISNQLLPLR